MSPGGGFEVATCPISTPWLLLPLRFDTEAFSGSLSPLHLCGMEFPEEQVVAGVPSLLALSFCAELG